MSGSFFARPCPELSAANKTRFRLSEAVPELASRPGADGLGSCTIYHIPYTTDYIQIHRYLLFIACN